MKTISNRKPAVKAAKLPAVPFLLNKAAAMKMEQINWNEEFALVKDKKGKLFTRTYWPEIKKDGEWRPLSVSVWMDENKLKRMGWDNMPTRQKRVNYKMTPVTRPQAVKWLITENIPDEFEPDFMKMHKAAYG